MLFTLCRIICVENSESENQSITDRVTKGQTLNYKTQAEFVFDSARFKDWPYLPIHDRSHVNLNCGISLVNY